jgi:pimeloyl-ACP methyl ester carboxylesterase
MGSALVRLLSEGHADRATGQFDPTIKAGLSAPQLSALWTELLAKHGAFVGVERVDAETVKDYYVENVVCDFAHGRRAVRVVFNKDGKVAGLFVRNADEARARSILGMFAGHDVARVESLFAPDAAKVLDRKKLAQAWNDLRATAGEYSSSKRVTEQGGALIVEAAFSKGDQRIAFSFDDHGRLLGMHLLDPLQRWTAPGYIDGTKFEERRVQVGPQKLDGVLDAPKTTTRFPGVVLVSGSGPNDADETLGALKPFRDIAEGLASRGIAVLRFEKRTHRGVKVRTVRDEYIDDVDAAVDLMSALPNVGTVVLVGHSMGATLAPRIALGNPTIRGVALLAGSTWPFSKVIVEQLIFQKARGVPNLDGLLDSARAAAKQIEDPNLKPDDVVPLGAVPGAYFIDLRGYSAVDAASKLSVPIFIGWGDHDLKTIPADFDGWRSLARACPEILHVLDEKMR